MNTSVQKVASTAASTRVGSRRKLRLAGAATSTSAAAAMPRPAPCTSEAEQDDGRRHQRQRLARNVADRRAGNDKGARNRG